MGLPTVTPNGKNPWDNITMHGSPMPTANNPQMITPSRMTPKTNSALVNVVYLLIERELHDIEMDLRECQCPDVVLRAITELRELYDELATLEHTEALQQKISDILRVYAH